MRFAKKIMSAPRHKNKLKKSFFQHFFPLAVFLLAFCCCLRTVAIEPCEVKIFSRNSTVDLSEIKTFFRTVDVVISRIIPSPNKKKVIPQIYTIVLVHDKDFKKVNIINGKLKGIRFYLPENTKVWAENDKILSSIVAAVLLKKCGYSPDNNQNNLPPWLVYGILSKVKRRMDKANIPGIMTFPGIHMLLTSGVPPNLLKISTSPVRAGDGPAYDVFLEASEIMLESTGRLPKNREAIKDLIDLSMQGIPPENSFIQIFSKKVHNMLQNTTEISQLDRDRQINEELQDWLIDNATLLAVNAFNPGNADFAERQFRKIGIVRYISVVDDNNGKAKEERYCKVENLKEKKKDIKNFPALVRFKELEFARLEFAVPASMQPSLYRIKRALHKLRADSSYDFKKEFLDAKQQFYNEIEKYNEIDAYLKQMEFRFVPESWRYRTELKEIEKSKNKERRRWPTLTKYLDSVEKE